MGRFPGERVLHTPGFLPERRTPRIRAAGPSLFCRGQPDFRFERGWISRPSLTFYPRFLLQNNQILVLGKWLLAIGGADLRKKVAARP